MINVVFQQPEWLWGIILTPFILLGAWRAYQKRKQAFADPWVHMHLVSGIRSGSELPVFASPLPNRTNLFKRWVLCCIVYLLFIIVLAEPVRKIIQQRPIFGGIRITFLLDTSLSMAYGRDLEPNRLAVARKSLQDVVNFLWNDHEIPANYQVAVIPFAGAAFSTSFIFSTSPYEIISYLQEVDENTIDVQGTDLYAAITAWENLLSRFPAEPNTTDLGILISDGGKEGGQEKNRLETIQEVIQLHTRDPDIVLYTVGIGKVWEDNLGVRHADEVPLVEVQDERGRVVSYYRRKPNDPASPIFTSALDEKILRQLAAAGGGSYHYIDENSTFYENLKSILLSQQKIIRYEAHEEYTLIPTWFLIPLLGIFFYLAGYGRWISIGF
jgi:hypothetical protein